MRYNFSSDKKCARKQANFSKLVMETPDHPSKAICQRLGACAFFDIF